MDYSSFIPFDVVFLSGGIGNRMQSSIPKQYMLINDKPLALYSFDVFLAMAEVQTISVVCEEQYVPLFEKRVQYSNKKIVFARPGQRRQDSVFNGVSLISSKSLVCVHDAARPIIDEDLVRRTVNMANLHGAAILGVKVKPTIKRCNAEQKVLQTPQRSELWEVQTPQVMRQNCLYESLVYAAEQGLTVSDDSAALELLHKDVYVVEGSYRNIKVTTPEDLIMVEQFLRSYALL